MEQKILDELKAIEARIKGWVIAHMTITIVVVAVAVVFFVLGKL